MLVCTRYEFHTHLLANCDVIHMYVHLHLCHIIIVESLP